MTTKNRKTNIPYPAGSKEYSREYSRIRRAEKKQKTAQKKRKVRRVITKPAKKGTPHGGPAPMDAAISDNFNTEKTIQPTAEDLARAKDILGLETDEEPEATDDALDAFAMLEDMRFAYLKAGGRKKLVKMVKGDNKSFASMVKDLIKIESALMTTQIRTKSAQKGGKGDGGQNFFVVLKGLESENTVVEAMEADDDVDLPQIESVLNPESHLRPVGQLEEEDRSKDAPPEDIFGVLGGLGGGQK